MAQQVITEVVVSAPGRDEDLDSGWSGTARDAEPDIELQRASKPIPLQQSLIGPSLGTGMDACRNPQSSVESRLAGSDYLRCMSFVFSESSLALRCAGGAFSLGLNTAGIVGIC